MGIFAKPHPFYPPDLRLDDFHAMTVPASTIFGVGTTIFTTPQRTTHRLTVSPPTRYDHHHHHHHQVFGASVLIIVLTLVKLSAHLSRTDRLIATWLAVTGAIHMVIEGYVVVTPDYYQHPSENYLSEAWKEYTKADSRYASRDSFVISMEAVTAFLVGPLCFVATHGILRNKPWRWALSLVVSVCQVYGDLLYYGTCFLEGFVHSRPEPLYFWVYFVLLNALWVVIPACVGAHAWRQLLKKDAKVVKRW